MNCSMPGPFTTAAEQDLLTKRLVNRQNIRRDMCPARYILRWPVLAFVDRAHTL